jgi:hypothetical protein
MTFLGKLRVFAGCLLLILLSPVLLPVVAILGLFDKGRVIAPVDFATLLRRIADDTIDDEWDEFESVRIRDKRLEAIRLKAFPFCGRPGIVDGKALYALAAEAEALPPLTE